MALAAYRHILRAMRIAFSDDGRMLLAARYQARTSFATGKSLLPDSSEASERITHAEDVAKILRQNVVQGRKIESKEDQYQLRIHKETERGDNDTIKTSGKGQGATTGQRCGGR